MAIKCELPNGALGQISLSVVGPKSSPKEDRCVAQSCADIAEILLLRLRTSSKIHLKMQL